MGIVVLVSAVLGVVLAWLFDLVKGPLPSAPAPLVGPTLVGRLWSWSLGFTWIALLVGAAVFAWADNVYLASEVSLPFLLVGVGLGNARRAVWRSAPSETRFRPQLWRVLWAMLELAAVGLLVGFATTAIVRLLS